MKLSAIIPLVLVAAALFAAGCVSKGPTGSGAPNNTNNPGAGVPGVTKTTANNTGYTSSGSNGNTNTGTTSGGTDNTSSNGSIAGSTDNTQAPSSSDNCNSDGICGGQPKSVSDFVNNTY